MTPGVNGVNGQVWIPAQRTDEMITAPAFEPSGEVLPATVLDLDLADPLPAVAGVGPDGRRVLQAWVLVRLFTEPLGTVLADVPAHGLRPADLAAAIDAELGPVLAPRLADLALTTLPIDGITPVVEPAFLARRRAVLATAPPITVVICTRERPGALARCLDSLLAQAYPDFRILVVDNAPVTDATAEVVRSAARRGNVDYLVEPRGGLSFARNAAVAAAPGEILAWIDDDEYADVNWLAEVARALADHPEADVVSGVIVPAELETKAQLWFEQFGGHSKGRGFRPDVFSPATAHLQSPLYPLPPFGTGANMTFRAGVIERIGGWDTALGAGTPAMGSEDTLAFTQVLVGGGTIVYQPTAVTHHYHRRDLEGLHKQMVGYGAGLTAAYTSLLLKRPGLLWPLLKLAPGALRDLTSKDSLRVSTLREDFPRELLTANRRGMLAGPRAYLQGRRAARRGH
ncbi:glycosyltransferase [Actinoplanes friuliensis]|uniref:Glycosyl transferase family 2 protein n=1 Tax=Actinoplanes friuliensis DSM 7358 TaxID=1246995 RepID=U5W211_9ACTN|nr:glycosyltransferase family 2 protein [Actinoplanes friuliensis]AGZ43268.1 glycosyl transferase family 2 protein [Actinoplanes friuliensis DSM 7358]